MGCRNADQLQTAARARLATAAGLQADWLQQWIAVKESMIAVEKVGDRSEKGSFIGQQNHHLKHLSTKAKGKGVGNIALGVGLGCGVLAVTGTAVYAAFNPNFRQLLVDKISAEVTLKNEDVLHGYSKGGSINNKSLDDRREMDELPNENELKSIEESEPAIHETGTFNIADSEAQVESITKILTELQAALHTSCFAAISAYSLAAQAVRGLTEELDKHAKEVHDGRAHQSSQSDMVVLDLLERNRNGRDMILAAEQAARQARKQMDVLKMTLSELCCSNVPIPNELIKGIEESLDEVETQIEKAEEFLQHALTSTEPPEILQKRVSVVTADLEEELGFSFVGCGNSEQRDTFLQVLAWQLLQYRRDVANTLAAHKKQTEELLAARGEQGMEIRLQALVQAKEAELKHSLKEDNIYHLSQAKKKLEQQLREEIRTQQWCADEAKELTLRDKRAAFERELAEQWDRAIDMTNENRQHMINELERVSPNLSKLEDSIKQSSDALLLSTLSHSMIDALTTDPFPQLDWSHQVQPIDHLLSAIHDVSCDGAEEFVHIITKSIPSKAVTRGVYTLDALKKRFNEVEQLARKVSMLKDKEGNSLVMYLMSYLRSQLLIHPVSVVSLSEKQNKPKNQAALNNEEILDRAKFFMDQGDFRQAICYMNLLQGVSQFVSSGWTEEMLVHLEVKQAAEALAAFSTVLVKHNINQ